MKVQCKSCGLYCKKEETIWIIQITCVLCNVKCILMKIDSKLWHRGVVSLCKENESIFIKDWFRFI